MKLPALFVALTLTLSSASLQQPAQQPASLSGVVRDAETGKPLSRVFVRVGDHPQPVTTDAGGAFSFSGLPPGRQGIRASRAGYVLSGFLAPHLSKLRFHRDNGLYVDLRPGQSLQLDLGMSIAPELTGTVLDKAGEPVVRASISVYEQLYDPTGEPFIRWLSLGASTDDRGEFRLDMPAPRQYLLSAGKAQSAGGSVYPASFYPAGSDISSAEPITFNPGESIRLRPLVLNSEPAALLRLSMVDNQGNPFEGYVGFQVKRRGDPGRPLGMGELLWLSRGSYDVESSVSNAATSNSSPLLRSAIVGHASVEIADKDIALVLRPAPAARVEVQVRKRDNGQLSEFAGPQVRLHAMRPLNPRTFGATASTALPEVPHGRYRVQVPSYGEDVGLDYTSDTDLLSAPRDLCVSEILHDGVPLSTDTLTISGTSSTVTVIFENSTTRIKGNAVDAANQAAAGAIVTLVPADGHALGYSATSTDQDGLFAFRCARQGSYRIYAWSELPGAAHRNAAFIKRFEARGTAVQITKPGAEHTLQTTVIEP